MLKIDPHINKVRDLLVPDLLEEDIFWMNYFYQCEVIKL
jgi:hypothetical protein